MDYEKKYKAALEWMKSLYGGLHGKTKEEAEKYFPELKESEEDRVKKELLELIGCMHDADPRKERWLAWLEKQGQEKHLSEPIKDYQGSFTCWNNAHDFRPKHLQRCICYDKYMGGVYCYVYDDISKYWCTQTTEEHDSDGDNHISDYADYRITLWMPLPDTSFYPSKSLLEKQGKPKWTDEDEERLQSCIIALQGKGLMGGVDTMDSKWLKSLKQRMG